MVGVEERFGPPDLLLRRGRPGRRARRLCVGRRAPIIGSPGEALSSPIRQGAADGHRDPPARPAPGVARQGHRERDQSAMSARLGGCYHAVGAAYCLSS